MTQKFRTLRRTLFFLIPAVLVLLTRSGLSAQGEEEMFSEPMSPESLFSQYAAAAVPELYSDASVTYRFKVTGADIEAAHIDLTGGEAPHYSMGGERYEMNAFQNVPTSILITLPPIHGAREVAMLPIAVGFERIAVEEANRGRSEGEKITVSGTEQNRVTIPLPDEQGGDGADSLTIEMNYPYTGEEIIMPGGIKAFCYLNDVVGTSGAGVYHIKYWFEPTRFGFVKFEVDVPEKKTVTLELQEVNGR